MSALCLQVVFESLYGEQTSPRLKELTVQFVHHLCIHCPDNVFKLMGQVLLSGTFTTTCSNILGPDWLAVIFCPYPTPAFSTSR